MQQNKYFQKALSDFTYEAASGGAIRHLASLGYTVKQITEELAFPTPFARVQQEVWKCLVDGEIILLEEPGSGGQKAKVSYVREYDKFGRAAFRQVVEEAESRTVAEWKEYRETGAGAAALLRALTEKNGEAGSYASLDFGLTAAKNPGRYEAQLQAMGERGREYVSGLPWERRRVYHRLDLRMREILEGLCETGLYQGECFFLETQEKLLLAPGSTAIQKGEELS